MRPVIYQLFVRHFSNFTPGGVEWGSREQNGCGTFAGVNDAALDALARMGVTHLWLTGVLRHATQTPHPGLPAAPACVVKGIAGSPYAVTDYFDVDPDLAENPAQRLEEFRALLERVRCRGMVPMIDFIPNHVSRCYSSTLRPELSFGRDDDTAVFFARDNSFYYVEPCGEKAPLVLPDGEFVPEYAHARVTGNNAATRTPDACDWYETVKLNYGCDYRHGAYAAEALPAEFTPSVAVPRTWRLLDEVLSYWQNMGVGGFRCDMAHMVPMHFWRWSIVNARLRDENVFFVAEAYNDHMKLCPADAHEALLAAGFNAVYDSAAYRGLVSMYEGCAWANDLDALNRPETALATRGVRYVENHDEPRLASPLHWAGQGAAAARALMVAQYTTTCGPVLFYNGQEVGEQAAGPGGFGGDNGRTSIFDYTNLPRLQHWSNGGLYDGAHLTDEEAALRMFCSRLLPLLQHPALSKGSFYGLNWANMQTPGYGRMPGEAVSGHRLYAFLRHNRKARATVLIVCNFDTTAQADTCIHIPADACAWAGKKGSVFTFCHLLNPSLPDVVISAESLTANGLPLQLPPGYAAILEWK
ncbi:MAG: hypothetical protein IJN29_02005 [Akkermansia sp.]|nr:hypothetical protein [Akkermansia sp.]